MKYSTHNYLVTLAFSDQYLSKALINKVNKRKSDYFVLDNTKAQKLANGTVIKRKCSSSYYNTIEDSPGST